jgi:hypothetical protein
MLFRTVPGHREPNPARCRALMPFRSCYQQHSPITNRSRSPLNSFSFYCESRIVGSRISKQENKPPASKCAGHKVRLHLNSGGISTPAGFRAGFPATICAPKCFAQQLKERCFGFPRQRTPDHIKAICVRSAVFFSCYIYRWLQF